MKHKRKSKIEIMYAIKELLSDNKARKVQTIATELNSHWLTVRECLTFLVNQDLVQVIETDKGQHLYFIFKR